MQVGDFLFDPDEGNGQQRFTYKGNELDMTGRPRGERPTIGALQDPLPGARAYYLSPGGEDGPQRGSRAAPWATADYALARMRPGDLLVLLAGTYRQPIVVRRSGTRRDFLHIVAENPPYATPPKFPTSGPTVIDAASCNGPAVLLDGCGARPRGGAESDQLAGRGRRRAPQHQRLRARICLRREIRPGGHPRHRPRQHALRVQRDGRIVGYELAGSLTDVRWCAAEKCPVGFRAVGPVAGFYLLQNRHFGQGGAASASISPMPSSDVVLDGNWAEDETLRPMTSAAPHHAGQQHRRPSPTVGIRVDDGADIRLFNNTLLRCARDGLIVGRRMSARGWR